LSDYERFGIDPDRPGAEQALDIARFMHERGVPLHTLQGLGLRALQEKSWPWLWGPSGDPIGRDELAKSAGMSEERLRMVVRALGLPDSFTLVDHDAAMLQLFTGAAVLIGEEGVMELVRVIGSGMARIADAAASATRVNYETPRAGQGSHYDFLAGVEFISRQYFPALIEAMGRVFRHHVVLVSAQDWGTDAELSATTLPLVVGFADMVGFTEHAGSASTKQLARVIDEFEGRVADGVVAEGGRVVKFIGDEVLFTFADAGRACTYARTLLDLASAEAMRDVRIGLTYGSVITRYGDVYGPVVNLASRLVDVAPPGGVLVTPEVAERAGSSFTFDARDPVMVKGVDRPVDNLLLR
jgi:adenylate cyclase